MEEKSFQDTIIRLADGKSARLEINILSDGTFESTIITETPVQEKIISRKFKDQECAIDFFEYLKENRHVPNLTGKYKKMATDLEQAKVYAQGQIEDGNGSSYFDSVFIYLPKWQKKMVINAAKSVGLDCSKHERTSRYVFSIPRSGNCSQQTRTSEIMSDFLKNIGYNAGVFYMLD